MMVREGIETPKELRWVQLLRRRLAEKASKNPERFDELDG
jgi:hypothetical protein